MYLEPITISVSSIQDYQLCPLRWCYRYLENRVSNFTPLHLRVGTAFHKIFERHFTTHEPMNICCPAILSTADEDVIAEFNKNGWEEALSQWKDTHPIEETLEVETPFAIPLSRNTTLAGTPDRVVVIFGKAFHYQHKTVNPKVSMRSYIDQAEYSLHEAAYGYYIQQKYPDIPYGGSIYNIFRKLNYLAKSYTLEDQVSKGMFQAWLSIPQPRIQQAMEDISVLATQMRQTASDYWLKKRVVPNYSYPYTYDDPYEAVVHGLTTLADPLLFTDRVPRYKGETHDAQ